MPDLFAENWLGLAGPAYLPAAITARLHEATNAAIATAIVRQRLDEHGVTPAAKTQVEFAAFVAQEVGTIGGMVRALGITAQ